MTLRLVPPDPEWSVRYAAEAAGIRASEREAEVCIAPLTALDFDSAGRMATIRAAATERAE